MPSSPGIPNFAVLSGDLDADKPLTELRLPNGQIIRIETTMLLADRTAENAFAETELVAADGSTVIPLIEERLLVGKQTVETGRVRLIKTVSEYKEQLNEPLSIRTFDIERVQVNEPVEVAPGVRHEGDTTIYPVVEEQLILTKRLVLKEEIRVTLRDSERRDTQVVTLHREHLTVEREDLTGKSGQ